MKNLLEEGFDVTGFDRNEYLGGLWHYDERVKISVLESIPYVNHFLNFKPS